MTIGSKSRQFLAETSRRFFRNVEIPDCLDNVENRDVLHEVDPSSCGLQNRQVEAIWQAVRSLYGTGAHPGVAFCLNYRGKRVLNRTLGHARSGFSDDSASVPLSIDTPLCLFSASKAVMAILVHKLAEDGYVDLLRPVADYIPEFGMHGKEKISIYQMLAHRGGFPFVVHSPEMAGVVDRQVALETIYNTPCRSPQGKTQSYHAVTTGFIADELIRRTAGCPMNVWLKEKIADPMGMTYFTFGLDAAHRDKVAYNYVTGIKNPLFLERKLKSSLGVTLDEAAQLSNSDAFMDAIIPSGNLFATAEEATRFYQMLLDNGQFEEQQILSPSTIAVATRAVDRMRFDRSLFMPMRFSAGFMLGSNPVGIYGTDCGEAFGHLGFSNIFCWADPARQLACSLICTGKPLIGSHILALPRLLHVITREISK